MGRPKQRVHSEKVEFSSREVTIGLRHLGGTLSVPDRPKGLVIFAHGSGSSRYSPRNQLVGRALNCQHLATLLLDLLTNEEAEDRTNVFDISLLGRRTVDAVRWARADDDVRDLPIGLFGASTGAAAALVAAADLPDQIGAVVSRGGRPDLAAGALPHVAAPTLLIVGSADTGVVELNKSALAHLTCEKRLALVKGATHLFEEPGALECVADLASDWFKTHLAKSG